MDSVNTNPLTRFFRKPSIYQKLPSGGKFWPEGSINLPDSGEIPVFPMTAADEITLKTPDALLNGQSIVDVLKSCCPNIVDPWSMPSIDVDTLLLAIRVATYGNLMPFDTKCPHCETEHSYELPLDSIMHSVTTPDFSQPLEIEGLKIRLKPQPYKSINRGSMINFEEQRIIQTINASDLTEDQRLAEFDSHLRRLVELNLNTITDCTESITTPDGVVVADPTMLREFYANTSSSIIKAVNSYNTRINEAVALKPQTVACTNCNQQFDIPVMFDYANFFA